MKYIPSIWLLIFISCNSDDNTVAGGPCTYKYDTLAAIVVNIPAIDSNQYDVVLVPDRQGKLLPVPDTIHYYIETRQLLSAAALKEKNIRLNDTFIYISGNISSGSCNPVDNRLLLERYRNKQ